MKRLGKNVGGYFGEQIDIHKFLMEVDSVAAENGWRREVFHVEDGLPLVAYRRTSRNPSRNIYISAGIHGDEPASPLAILQLMKEDRWPADADIWLCPCLNPVGFTLGKRENRGGHDLNRQYLNTEAREILAHKLWLEIQPRFDLCLCLHEDWESSGFYLYELNPDGKPSYAQSMIDVVGKLCPIDMAAEIEGRQASGGIIHPDIDPTTRPLWPEAFYLLMNKTRLNYTLEAPSDFDLKLRVDALVAAVRVAIESK